MAEDAETAAAAQSARFLTFSEGDNLYAVPVQRIAEIVRVPMLAKVPHAPAALLGLANLRGSILPAASLSGLLKRAPKPTTAQARAIVIDGAAPFALFVDAIQALVSVEPKRIETRFSEVGANEGEHLVGAFAVDGKTVKILDLDLMLQGSFAPQERQKARRSVVGNAPTPKGAAETGVHSRQMLVTFEVAQQEYALDFSEVQEVVGVPDALTVLPGADAQVRGLVPYRNGLLPMLSLRGLMGLPAVDRSGREKMLVTRIRGVPAGLVVDAIRRSVAADPARMEDVPPVMAARIGGEAKVKAIYRSEAGGGLISVLAPDLLLKEETMRRLGNVAAPQPDLHAAVPSAKVGEINLLVFKLGEEEFALPVEAVDEVTQLPVKVTRVPKTPKFLEGVVNLRGEVLPVVDQRKRFNMPPLERPEGSRLVVVHSERHRAALIVDRVVEVLSTSPDTLEPAPDLTGEPIRLVKAVVNIEHESRIILILDAAELLSRAERDLLDSFQPKLPRQAT